MRQLLLSTRALPGLVIARLGMEETVWEDGYARVMGLPAGRPLAVFWRHYYGSSAEMLLTPALLPGLLADIAGVLQDPGLPPPLTAFLSGMRDLCAQALRTATTAQLEVIAD